MNADIPHNDVTIIVHGQPSPLLIEAIRRGLDSTLDHAQRRRTVICWGSAGDATAELAAAAGELRNMAERLRQSDALKLDADVDPDDFDNAVLRVGTALQAAAAVEHGQVRNLGVEIPERLREAFKAASPGEWASWPDHYEVRSRPAGSNFVNEEKIVALTATGEHAGPNCKLIAEMHAFVGGLLVQEGSR